MVSEHDSKPHFLDCLLKRERVWLYAYFYSVQKKKLANANQETIRTMYEGIIIRTTTNSQNLARGWIKVHPNYNKCLTASQSWQNYSDEWMNELIN